MDFNLSQEQKQFADSLRRWAEKDYAFEARNKIIHSNTGTSSEVWEKLVELGVTALPVPEAQGGFSGSAVDMMVVMQEMGRALLVEPYFATVMGARFLRLAGGRETLLEKVAAGELKLASALYEVQSRYDLADIKTTAVKGPSCYILNGAKSVVVHGGQAEMLLVSALLDNEPALFLVRADARGVLVRDYRAIDGQRAADIDFHEVEVDTGNLLGRGLDLIEAGVDYGIALLCAEAVGAMDALNAATLEYLKTRQQFGVPIGKFQALQHRMADMMIHAEQARSMATLVAVHVDSANATWRMRYASAAKARIGQAARFIGQQAVQLHGGMGVTDELPASHYFKRLTMIELSLGDTDHHLARFASLPGFRQGE